MLAGLAMKWRWREKVGKDWRKGRTPNLVMGSNVQVVWEKFCRYFDVEPRYLPMEEGRYVITPEQVLDAVDEDTIGVVAILGTTFTGELEPIAEICAALDKLAADGGVDVPVHVDAASGGFVVPFLHPDLVWDFRLPRVVSINVSGHKYGLTYPGIGFVVWRSAEHLPEELVFRVNYLGGDMPTFTLNFSRPGNQVVGQYYNFLRLGRAGYTQVMPSLSQTARWLGDQLRESRALRGDLRRLGDPGGQLPAGRRPGYTEFDVSHALRAFGWQVPAYTMPDDATDVTVLRIVVREGFSADLARALKDDIITALEPRRAQARRPLRRVAALRALTARSVRCNPRPRARSGTIGGGDMTMQTTDSTSLTPTAAAEAVVDLDAIAHNVRLLREHAGSAQVMAVVKADGYGHGAAQVGRAALAAGAAELGVATIDEALALRRDGITAPVLAWLHAPGTDFAPALPPTCRWRCPRCANSARCSTRSTAPAAPRRSPSRSTPG